MAVRQLEAGNLEHAFDAATRMNLAERKDQLLNQLVLAQLQGDNLHDALGTAKLISVAQLRDEMLNQVAMAQFRAGNFQEAIATAILMKIDQHRDKVLGRVVDKYREAWKLQEALSIAEQIYHDGWRRQHLHNIARGQVDAGDQGGAKATANRIEESKIPSCGIKCLARLPSAHVSEVRAHLRVSGRHFVSGPFPGQ